MVLLCINWISHSFEFMKKTSMVLIKYAVKWKIKGQMENGSKGIPKLLDRCPFSEQQVPTIDHFQNIFAQPCTIKIWL